MRIIFKRTSASMHCLLTCLIMLMIWISLGAQITDMPSGKMTMDESVYHDWKRISNVQITKDGTWVLYDLIPGWGNHTLKIYERNTGNTYSFDRAEAARFSADDKYVVFKIVHDKKALQDLKRKKTKTEDLPKDSLAIYFLEEKRLQKIPDLRSYATGEEWSSHLAMQLDSPEQDSLYGKKESDENGFHLTVKNVNNNQESFIPFVTKYMLAEEEPSLFYATTGDDSLIQAGIYHYDIMKDEHHLMRETDGKIYQWSADKSGSQFSVIMDEDTTKILVRPYQLFLAKAIKDNASLEEFNLSRNIPEEYLLSSDQRLGYSEDGSHLYFGMRTVPMVQDTSLLAEEIVEVEIWNYKDGKLYTQQEVQASDERKRSYDCVLDLRTEELTMLETVDRPSVLVDRDMDQRYTVSYSDLKYQKYISWLGFSYNDIYLTDQATGETSMILERCSVRPSLSPGAKYIYWYERENHSWYALDLSTEQRVTLVSEKQAKFYDEINDRPMDPWPYGIAGWSADDEYIFIYDRYDIWQVSPSGSRKPKRITKGRKDKLRYRYQRLDPELDTIPMSEDVLLTLFDEDTKESGYMWARLEEVKSRDHSMGDYQIGRRFYKAEDADVYVHTRETFEQFPDLLLSETNLNDYQVISKANPQQADYLWGSGSLHQWKSDNGEQMTGMLFLPEGFDGIKKYPMIVNFYERSSDGLHRHRAPEAHRSTINYTMYLNNGYVIFNPDVPYDIGYPGRSCEEAVISGVRSVLDLGFVDPARVGVQGHSWGGYQVAHLLTKTDMFACAESGAPVVNMVSAYGGIRWRSGMSRMFQYERTQSRLGATLWERPDLYIENSPVFNSDKVNTPVLILHNDKDGAVPWYQGIEYFVSLRRLGKPSWLLNYNEEPHWPLKWQNRLDFQTRMKQFFDHYLQGAEMPRWMSEGVPAIHQGIDTGMD